MSQQPGRWRRALTVCLLACGLFGRDAVQAAEQAAAPNIIFILTDDKYYQACHFARITRKRPLFSVVNAENWIATNPWELRASAGN